MRSLFCFLIAFLIALPAANAEELPDGRALLKGKVVDTDGKPLSGVKIVLHNEDSGRKRSTKSNSSGYFEIEHECCSSLSFDAIPSHKTGFSHAHYSHISGELSKHVIVRLHKGFTVSGRVLADGKGVKGLEVRAISNEKGKQGNDATVHGGGKTITNNDGEYTLTLTPGKKTIQIKNDIYSNLSPLYQHEFTISSDTTLPDMTLPLLQKQAADD